MSAPISVVIPSRNAAATIAAQLDALGHDDNVEIIVVDNCSDDATAAIAREHGATVVRCDEIGANAARNAGVRVATFEMIAVCDADDVVGPGWAAAMAAALTSFDLVGGTMDLVTLNSALVQRCCHVHGHTCDDVPEGSIISANLAFRRSAWEAVGGFDEAFLHTYDDVDFIERARAEGCSIGYARDAVVAYRLRGDRREAARRVRMKQIGAAQLRAKLGAPQPPKAAALKAARAFGRTLCIWRCVTPEGRWRYAMDVARARGALPAWREYRIVP